MKRRVIVWIMLAVMMLAVVPGRKQLKLGELLVIPSNEDAKAGEESQRATDETINTVI